MINELRVSLFALYKVQSEVNEMMIISDYFEEVTKLISEATTVLSNSISLVNRLRRVENEESYYLATMLNPRYKVLTFHKKSTNNTTKRRLAELLTNYFRIHDSTTKRFMICGIWNVCQNIPKEAKANELFVIFEH